MPMHRIAFAASIFLALMPSEQARSPAETVEAAEAIVLGIAQDGGVPHLGCRQKLCVEARRDPSKRRRVACLGLVDGRTGKRFLIDATPDFESQVAALGGMPDGILLTHAHIGHYLGLAQLGREVANTHAIPVFCTPSMAAFLRANRPWRRLVESKNIEIREVRPGVPFELAGSLQVTAIPVPHRDEDSDTVAFLVSGPLRRLLWLPDIDKWEKWDRHLEDVVRSVDIAFLDGTFFSADEIPGRSIAEIPHPLVPETISRLSGREGAARVFFVHLNHTNRLLWDGIEVRRLEEKGFRVAFEGQRLPL